MPVRTQGEQGYIKLFRSLMSWEWFDDEKTLKLLVYLLLRVNYEPSRFRGMEIGRGEVLESLKTISENTKMSVQSVRTALNHLKSTGEVTCKVTRYGLLIKVLKYSLYQD